MLIPLLVYGAATAGLLWFARREAAEQRSGERPLEQQGVGTPAPVPGRILNPQRWETRLFAGDVVVVSTAGNPAYSAPYLIVRVESIAPPAFTGIMTAYLQRTTPPVGADLTSSQITGITVTQPTQVSFPVSSVVLVQRDGRARRFVPGAQGGPPPLQDPTTGLPSRGGGGLVPLVPR